MSKSKKLTAKQQLFVDEYIKDFNGSAAAVRAGYSEKYANRKAYELLNDERIESAVNNAIAERKERLRIDADNVLWQWWQIATADYNELTQLKRVNCRYCWGREHEYQWTPKEYEAACQQAEYNKEPEPVDIGGLDYDANRPPHPDCPECHGQGVEKVYIADTTKLSPAAKLIYQGIEQTKFGLKVNTVDRMKALDNVAKHIGMFKEQVEHTGVNGGPIVTANLTPDQVIERMKELDDEY